MTNSKLRPAIGDVWKYLDYPPTTLATYWDDGRWWGDRPDRVPGVTERVRADAEEVMLSDTRWVLVRPAGCPEGFVPCGNGCVRWTFKYDHERGDWCYKCLNRDEPTHSMGLDWTPPAERIVGAPAVPIVPTSKRVPTQGRIRAEDDDSARNCVIRLVPESAYEDRRRQGTTARPEYMATVYNEQDARRLVRLWNDGLDAPDAKKKEESSPSKSCVSFLAPTDAVWTLFNEHESRLKSLETMLAPAEPCKGPCCSGLLMPITLPKAIFRPCYKIGPGDSRCLRDWHDDESEHRFGLPVHWPL